MRPSNAAMIELGKGARSNKVVTLIRPDQWGHMRELRFMASALVSALACVPADRTAVSDARDADYAVRHQLAAYAAAAAAVDPDKIARFFAPHGTLFEPGIAPISTPDSIRAFIASFRGVVVDSAMLRADTVEVFGRTAIVWGTYFERLRFPGQPESAQHGRFVMEWRYSEDGNWYIARYYRVPLPAGWRDGS